MIRNAFNGCNNYFILNSSRCVQAFVSEGITVNTILFYLRTSDVCDAKRKMEHCRRDNQRRKLKCYISYRDTCDENLIFLCVYTREIVVSKLLY